MKHLLGIMGGTFDPIHYGHLRIALELAESLSIPSVHFMPAYQTVHRDQPHTSPEQRLQMLKLAIKAEARFVADARELNRKGPSYTIDSLRELKQEYPEKTLCLFLGCDAFLNFHTWHQYQEILKLAHLIIAKRPTFTLPENGANKQTDKAYVSKNDAGGILFLPTTQLDISGEEIRKQIALGRNTRYLLPDDVYEYIQLNGIYQR